jgi:hypothetical protein
VHCKICESATIDFGRLTILSRHEARYRRCEACGFVFVEDVRWLEEAYSAAIAASDTGIAVRNLRLAAEASVLIQLAFPHAQRFLDYGGGAGLFVRLMRDRGFDFRLLDKYCANVFAGGFEAEPADRFDVLTCFEVIEHLVDPLPAFRELAALAPAMIIGTELLPARRNRPGEWWYYAPETGQHVSFYTRRALETIGERLHLRLATNGRNLHVLAGERIGDAAVKLATSRARALAGGLLKLAGRRRRSLTHRDAERFRSLSRP